jgi:hypothetical protein
VQRQNRQHCPAPHTAHRPRPAVHDDINWPKKPHLHAARPHGEKQCQSTSMNRFRFGGDVRPRAKAARCMTDWTWPQVQVAHSRCLLLHKSR